MPQARQGRAKSQVQLWKSRATTPPHLVWWDEAPPISSRREVAGRAAACQGPSLSEAPCLPRAPRTKSLHRRSSSHHIRSRTAAWRCSASNTLSTAALIFGDIWALVAWAIPAITTSGLVLPIMVSTWGSERERFNKVSNVAKRMPRQSVRSAKERTSSSVLCCPGILARTWTTALRRDWLACNMRFRSRKRIPR